MGRQILFTVLAAAGGALLAAQAAPPLGAAAADPVRVVNLPDVQRIEGAVRLTAPLPTTRFVERQAVVSPAAPDQPHQLTDGGTIATDGFGLVALSLAGELNGSVAGTAAVGALLVPDRPELLAALREDGRLPFALRVEARLSPEGPSRFASDTVVSPVAFPSYRVFFYDTSPRSARVTLWAYLSQG